MNHETKILTQSDIQKRLQEIHRSAVQKIIAGKLFGLDQKMAQLQKNFALLQRI